MRNRSRALEGEVFLGITVAYRIVRRCKIRKEVGSERLKRGSKHKTRIGFQMRGEQNTWACRGGVVS